MNTSSPEAVGMSSERLNRINVKMQEYVDNKNVAGLITLIARKGQIIHYEVCGQRDVEQGLPMAKDTILRIYSMTKPITSIALMQLYEQGKFQLFDPVSKYIPEFGETKVFNRMGVLGPELVEQSPPMTIQHLLTHTSGLTYGWFQHSPVEEMYRQSDLTLGSVTLEEWAHNLSELPLMFQPGSAWNYSVSTDLLGYLVQVLADQPFAEVLTENILSPLGMTETSFSVAEDQANRLATLYYHNPADGSFTDQSQFPDAVQDYTKPPTAPSGGGGLVSTTEDYVKFAQMLLNKGELNGTRLVGRKTLDYMTINHLPTGMPMAIGDTHIAGTGFGLGFAVSINPAEAAVMSSVNSYGWSGAAATNFWIDPQEEIVAIIMTQLMNNTLPLHSDFRVLTYQALID